MLWSSFKCCVVDLNITLICVTQMQWECHVTPDHFDTFESMMGVTLLKGPKWHLLSLRTLQGVLELLHCRVYSSWYTAGCSRVATLHNENVLFITEIFKLVTLGPPITFPLEVFLMAWLTRSWTWSPCESLSSLLSVNTNTLCLQWIISLCQFSYIAMFSNMHFIFLPYQHPDFRST